MGRRRKYKPLTVVEAIVVILLMMGVLGMIVINVVHELAVYVETHSAP